MPSTTPTSSAGSSARIADARACPSAVVNDFLYTGARPPNKRNHGVRQRFHRKLFRPSWVICVFRRLPSTPARPGMSSTQPQRQWGAMAASPLWIFCNSRPCKCWPWASLHLRAWRGARACSALPRAAGRVRKGQKSATLTTIDSKTGKDREIRLGMTSF